MTQPKSRDARIIEALEKAFDFWVETRIALRKASEAGEYPEALTKDLMFGWTSGTTAIGSKCRSQLEQAARLLIEGARLERRISLESVRGFLREGFEQELENARSSGLFNTEQLVRHLQRELKALKTADGLYAFPVLFAPGANGSDFHIGPARIMSMSVFQAEFDDALALTPEETADTKTARPLLREDWTRYAARFDHIIVVDIQGHDEASAWETGREVAEYTLNLIRMRFGHRACKDIRLANGYPREDREASLRVTRDGKIAFSALRRWPGASFDDHWMNAFDEGIDPFQMLCASFAYWLASGRDPTDPVLERARFANQLLSEAYSEPHEHVRLVRLISALEALSLITGKDKAHHLAYRCACVGGWCDSRRATEIYDAVREAYGIRSAIVHGDGALASAAYSSFLSIERHALEIVVGFFDLFAKLRAKQSFQSIGPLRRAVAKNIDWYFWNLI